MTLNYGRTSKNTSDDSLQVLTFQSFLLCFLSCFPHQENIDVRKSYTNKLHDMGFLTVYYVFNQNTLVFWLNFGFDCWIHFLFAALRDEQVWGGGLFIFYHVFAYLEDAKARLNMPAFDKLFINKILYRFVTYFYLMFILLLWIRVTV